MELAGVIIAGVIASIIGVISSISTNETNTQNVQATNRTNQEIQQSVNDLQMQLAGQTNRQSIEQWSRENLYNSPSAQLARLRAAGLNPNMVYGDGGLMNEASSSPQMNMANVEAMRNVAPQIQNPVDVPSLQQIADVEMKQAQIDRIKTQNYKDMNLLPYQQDSLNAAADTARSLASLNQQSIAESASRISVNEQTANKLTEETKSFTLNNQFLMSTMEDRCKMVLNQREISDIDVQYFEDKTKQALNESRALTKSYLAAAQASYARADVDKSQKQFLVKQIDGYQRTLDNIDAQTKQIESQTDMQKIKNDLEKKYGPEKAEQEIKKMKQERICGYISTTAGAIHDVGTTVSSFMPGVHVNTSSSSNSKPSYWSNSDLKPNTHFDD